MTLKYRSQLLASAFLLLSCQAPHPTKIQENTPQAWASRFQENAKKPLKLNDQTIVLDARSEFDYGLAHWSSATHFGWEQLVEDARKPWLMLDKITAQKRLALLGIQPNTPVVVIGYGLKGKGEEGRLAWALVYYGLTNVQTVSFDGLDVYFTQMETPLRKNEEIWDRPLVDALVISKNEFINVASAPKKANGHSVHIIDVRSKDEYFNLTEKNYEAPDLHALQIDWHEFYGGDGRPLKKIRSKLNGVGVKLDDEVILLSNDSIRSSAAAYSLLALGFKNVRTFLGGWDSLVKQNK